MFYSEKRKRLLCLIMMICFALQIHVMAETELSDTASSETEDCSGIVIQAHGGGAGLGPENTLSALKAAKAAGADGFETDLWMTKDGHLVLRHDDRIDLTSNGSGRISEMTLEELKTYDFGSRFGEEYAGEQILTLEECLSAAEELDFQIVNLEIKPTRQSGDLVLRTLVDTIRSSGMTGRVMVSSFDHEILRELKEYAPEIPVGTITIPNLSVLTLFDFSTIFPAEKAIIEYTVEDLKNFPEPIIRLLETFGAKGDTPEEILMSVVEGIAAIAAADAVWSDVEEQIQEQADLTAYVDSLGFHPDYLICHYNTLTAELVKAMHERQTGVYAWTPDSEADLGKTINACPDGIITNEPERAGRLVSIS